MRAGSLGLRGDARWSSAEAAVEHKSVQMLVEGHRGWSKQHQLDRWARNVAELFGRAFMFSQDRGDRDRQAC